QSWTVLEALLHAHSHHEDNHFHPLIRQAAPAVADLLDSQHAVLDATVDRIGKDFDAIAALTHIQARPSRGRRVSRPYTAFAADYFGPLLAEETQAMPALLAHFPVTRLLAAHQALLAEIGPQKMLADLPLIIRALAPQERLGLMLGARASAPPA